MPMSPQERAELDRQLTGIYDWGQGVDEWGRAIGARVDFIDAELEAQRTINADNATWRADVDAWGETADRRFLQLGLRTRDLQDSYIDLRRQVLAMRQIVDEVPWFALVMGVIVGLFTAWLVNDNAVDPQWTNWRITGVGVASGAIAFGVINFLVHAGHASNLQTAVQPPPANNQQPPQPATPAAAPAPTTVMPTVSPQPAQPPAAQPATTP